MKNVFALLKIDVAQYRIIWYIASEKHWNFTNGPAGAVMPYVDAKIWMAELHMNRCPGCLGVGTHTCTRYPSS